jgi:hypothetical protein
VGLFAGVDAVAGDLGPVYRLPWFMSEYRDRVMQDVYPFAASGPAVNTLRGDATLQE